MPSSSVRMKGVVKTDAGVTAPPGFPNAAPALPLRAPRRGGVPTLTVVIASSGTTAALDNCLASVCSQCARFDAELIVVSSVPGAEVHVLATLCPTARFVLAPADAMVPQLRSLGMAEANGDIVVFSDDAAVPENRWLATIMATVFPSDAELSASDQPFDWPAYFTASGAFTRKSLGNGER